MLKFNLAKKIGYKNVIRRPHLACSCRLKWLQKLAILFFPSQFSHLSAADKVVTSRKFQQSGNCGGWHDWNPNYGSLEWANLDPTLSPHTTLWILASHKRIKLRIKSHLTEFKITERSCESLQCRISEKISQLLVCIAGSRYARNGTKNLYHAKYSEPAQSGPALTHSTGPDRPDSVCPVWSWPGARGAPPCSLHQI